MIIIESLPHSSFLTCALSTYTPSTRASTRAPSLQGSEIEELRNAVANLSHQLKILTDSSQKSSNKNTIKRSSPIIEDQNMELQPMSSSFKKTLHDEVVQIVNSLDPNLLFDVKITFGNQKKHVNKKLLPAIKSAMNPSLKAYDLEIVKIIRQLHKSRHAIWKVQEEG
ncbi:hypothetical protein RhiirC2_792027 [Rhizophagus irregularis]|uniref:Uncharacterized protein n=1 Tax=Rhizophagus irregularis TaxID=588596 RepID=A0A2N1MI45_9GLOM|nr:hypothetical protein RhiirC2_792027 [Rhizophagus irregularis]